MPLHLPEPPQVVPDKIRSKLHEFADGSKFSTKALRGPRKGQLDVSTPHRVFTMGLEDVAAGAGLERARPGGWRYLVEDGGQLVASAEATVTDDGDFELAQFTEGPFVAATDKAVKAVRKLPQLAAAGFELRLLRIPALYMMALWLHAAAADLLVPLAPSPIGKDGKPMPASEFFDDLAEEVRPAGQTGPPEAQGPRVP
ncbi:hypothetical protein [Phytomonospora endophytica]|uniref:Uncharacterized protein n=1 Tax=Phytomonospora endophytica TaxID=714109 RepID=A0A841FWJ8_9ACTN|nr:hypothetical protein [Phytomonospora endophytica]MBB6037912.1 hypothetical protein [Phytomonospora endophytica]GIG68812.1 hypothetical protein Pen01_51070 [Phytomonospora endophytica]